MGGIGWDFTYKETASATAASLKPTDALGTVGSQEAKGSLIAAGSTVVGSVGGTCLFFFA